MPAVGRDKDKDKEQKPRKKPGRVPTSCAECRRLKLRCDRNVPCEKCVSRGCGSICPDGALTSGKGNRMILANTEELHDRIDHLTSRIRELEGALQTLQARVSNEPHPLLQKDLLQGLPPLSAPSRPSTSSSGDPTNAPAQSSSLSSPQPSAPAPMDPDPAAVTDSCGTLSLSENGQSSFFGSTARLEFLAHRTPKPEPKPARLSHELFEFACEEPRRGEDRLGKEILRLRPPASEALRLCELYLQNGKVMYTPIPRSELIDEIWMTVYPVESFSDLRQPETLALLFMVFALSSHFDPKRRAHNHDSNEYYFLAKACLRLSSHRENTLAYVQTLIHMSQYLHFSGAEATSPEMRLEYLSHAIRIGYKMGLHLHGIRWNLSDDRAQRRSRVFCEIFLLDTWTSFYSGRPPMVSLAFMDRTTPKDYDEGIDAEGNIKPGFHIWTYKYAILLHSVMAVAFGPKLPPYSSILDLDLKIRNFPVPAQWRPVCEKETPPLPREIYMARFMVSFAKESTLLNLHRSYFMSALEECPEDLSKHSFIPSILAIYRSAWRLMRGLRCVWDSVPELVSKMNVAWSQALSSAVVMCLFITRTPGSPLTDPALNELDLLVELFEDAVTVCRAASDLLNDLRSLRTYARATVGRPHENEGYPISSSDLDRLSGKTYLLMLSEPRSTSSALSPPTSTMSQQHHHQPHYPPGSARLTSAIKRDPSPSRSTSATLSDIPVTSPYGVPTPLPISPLHAPGPSTSHSLSALYPYPQSHPPSQPSHSHTSPYTHPSRALGLETAQSSSSSSSHFVQPQPPPPLSHPLPPPTSQTTTSSQGHPLHPTILQDIRDFTMRGAPASSSVSHYFDFPPEEDMDSFSMSMSPTIPGRNNTTGAGRGHSLPSASISTSTSTLTPRQRGQSLPSHHSQAYADYGYYQSLETSFHLDYTPQPRSPFSAANFGTSDSSFQDLALQLGFHQ